MYYNDINENFNDIILMEYILVVITLNYNNKFIIKTIYYKFTTTIT